VKRINVYVCEVCGTRYDDEGAALACEGRGVPGPWAAVGEFVTADTYGWFNGDEAWLVQPTSGVVRPRPCPRGSGNCFGRCCNYSPIYQVLSVEREKADGFRSGTARVGDHIVSRTGHRYEYKLATWAIVGTELYKGARYPRFGVTIAETHFRPRRLDPQPDLVWPEGGVSKEAVLVEMLRGRPIL
jgi:hypothetical protein